MILFQNLDLDQSIYSSDCYKKCQKKCNSPGEFPCVVVFLAVFCRKFDKNGSPGRNNHYCTQFRKQDEKSG